MKLARSKKPVRTLSSGSIGMRGTRCTFGGSLSFASW